jgi:hypothetical protein
MTETIGAPDEVIRRIREVMELREALDRITALNPQLIDADYLLKAAQGIARAALSGAPAPITAADAVGAPAGAVPEGWKLVPVNPDADMLRPPGSPWADGHMLSVWKTMLAAAPHPPAAPVPEGKRWYIGAQNDGLFIIDAPPRPSTDDAHHGRVVGVITPLGDLSRDTAQAICDAHNATLSRPSEDGWRTIETAPKDATEIWLGCIGHGVAVGWAAKYGWRCDIGGETHVLSWTPTHWQPYFVPAPPQKTGG